MLLYDSEKDGLTHTHTLLGQQKQHAQLINDFGSAKGFWIKLSFCLSFHGKWHFICQGMNGLFVGIQKTNVTKTEMNFEKF